MGKLPSIIAASIIGLGLTSGSESTAKEKPGCEQIIRDIRDLRQEVENRIDNALKESEANRTTVPQAWKHALKNGEVVERKLKNFGRKCRQRLTGKAKEDFRSMIEEVTVLIAKKLWLEEIIKERQSPKNSERIPQERKPEIEPKSKPKKRGIGQNEILA